MPNSEVKYAQIGTISGDTEDLLKLCYLRQMLITFNVAPQNQYGVLFLKYFSLETSFSLQLAGLKEHHSLCSFLHKIQAVPDMQRSVW